MCIPTEYGWTLCRWPYWRSYDCEKDTEINVVKDKVLGTKTLKEEECIVYTDQALKLQEGDRLCKIVLTPLLILLALAAIAALGMYLQMRFNILKLK